METESFTQRWQKHRRFYLFMSLTLSLYGLLTAGAAFIVYFLQRADATFQDRVAQLATNSDETFTSSFATFQDHLDLAIKQIRQGQNILTCLLVIVCLLFGLYYVKELQKNNRSKSWRQFLRNIFLLLFPVSLTLFILFCLLFVLQDNLLHLLQSYGNRLLSNIQMNYTAVSTALQEATGAMSLYSPQNFFAFNLSITDDSSQAVLLLHYALRALLALGISSLVFTPCYWLTNTRAKKIRKS